MYPATLAALEAAVGNPGAAIDIRNTFALLEVPGTAYYVSSVTGNSGFDGLSKTTPVATLAQALAKCTSAKGDVVYILPGHAESVNAAAYLDWNKTGVSIIGLGNGANRPTFSWITTDAAQVIVSGANTYITNCVFALAGVDAVVAAFSVTAADVTFDRCTFLLTDPTLTGTKQVILGILTAATALRFVVRNCVFFGARTATGGASNFTTACIKHEVGTDFRFENNVFSGKVTQHILNATAILGGVISGNQMIVATGTLAIALHSGTLALVTNNRMAVAAGTTAMVGAGAYVVGNTAVVGQFAAITSVTVYPLI